MIWVDDWQMQCCGEPFRIGSRISWTLAEPDPDWVTAVLGPDASIDAVEEHHGGVPDGTPETTGTVTAISAVHCRHAPQPGGNELMLYPVEASAILTPVKQADGSEPSHDNLSFIGYLVRVTT